MAVTRNDVARLAGVSPATVSYVINKGPRPVSEETRARVLRAIEQLGYQPNVMAQNLRRQYPNTVGLVFTTIERHLTHPYFVDLLTSIGEESAKYGFDMLLSACTDRTLEQSIYERMVGGAASGRGHHYRHPTQRRPHCLPKYRRVPFRGSGPT